MTGDMSRDIILSIFFIFVLTITCVNSRIHHLNLENDTRHSFKVSSFGYLQGGSLFVNVSRFSFKPNSLDATFGFSVIRTVSDSLSPYMEGHQRLCSLKESKEQDTDDDLGLGIISFVMDIRKETVYIQPSQSVESISIIDRTYHNEIPKEIARDKRSINETISNPVSSSSISGEQIRSVAANNNESAIPPQSNEQQQQQQQPKQLNTDNNNASMQDTKGTNKDIVNVANAQPIKEEKINETEPAAASAVKPPQSLNSEENNENSNNDPVKVDKEPVNVEETNPLTNEESREEPSIKEPIVPSKSDIMKIIKMNSVREGDETIYNFAFQIFVTKESEEGLFNLFFHSCKNVEPWNQPTNPLIWTNLSLLIIEKNSDNFLSAGEIPLPEIYFALSVIFFLLGVFWISVVKSKSQDAFKIHYIMGLLVFVKASALLFHGINFESIAKTGSQSETWAILYYITHFLKGALLFITIVLIGTGWAFIKHILSEKDKNLFMVVIPLQVLANIAEIITEESEEGEVFHNKWREIFILVDLLCCGAILFPVVWSIRHLQEAAHIDGKAAVNLKKLKLFRRFYVIIVCYIYFTRMIVYLLKVTVPFKYEWMDVLMSHAGIFVFFVLTGYHFQPTAQNPYFRVSQDEDLELEEVLFEVTPNIYTENLSKKRKHIVEVDCNDTEQLITKREASHDFD